MLGITRRKTGESYHAHHRRQACYAKAVELFEATRAAAQEAELVVEEVPSQAIEPVSHECPRCSKTFKSPAGLRMHVNIHCKG